MQKKTLLVIEGPTGVGKTGLSVELARFFGAEVVCADSRQFYREMQIGTARPHDNELQGVPHHFLGFLPLDAHYSCGQFESDAIKKLDELFSKYPLVILTGGSGLYVKAVCEGMDELPGSLPERARLNHLLQQEGLAFLVSQLEKADPVYFQQVDTNNPQRIIRALEVISVTGQPFSSFHLRKAKERPFNILRTGLLLDREQLYQRINLRVEEMLLQGLEQEARRLYPFKHLNSLQTVGYQEFFAHWDGEYSRETAIELIKRNTRRYAKRQMTWLRKQPNITWFAPTATDDVIAWVKKRLI